MPNIIDTTVVNASYDTSSNGGRKLVRTSNGYLFSVVKNSNTNWKIYKTIDNGVSWSLFTEVTTTGLVDVAIVTNKNNLYVMESFVNKQIGFRGFDSATGNLISPGVNVEVGQTDIGNVSLAINEAGTELHAAWASKNSTYTNSFNIRYAKGTINTDGSVAWGAVEQVTSASSVSQDKTNPSIAIVNGKPAIITTNRVTNYFIGGYFHDGSNWINRTIYDGGTYPQSAPSAIFVPQRINGLANGLMAVAWHGTDSIHTGNDYIRFSYSLDGGLNWSTMKKLVPGKNASLTADKTGKLFISFEISGEPRYITSTDNGVTWSSIGTIIGNGSGTNVSSLFDLTLAQQAPLNVRKGPSSVLFSGSWTVTSNSVPSGDIGQKTSKDNLLTYTVTTDGAMSTITEKVNGVTVSTKTATSGQSLTISLTQAQWDAVRYGKYANATGGRNTITIEMGTEVWTYTFDKIPPVDAQITELLKSHIDSADVAIPAKKALLGASIRGKGGTVNDTDSLEVMASVIGGIQLGVVGGKRWSSGTFTKNNVESHTITGIPFKPSIIFIWGTDANSNGYRFSMHESSELFGKEGVRFSDIYAAKTGYSTASGSRQFENALKAEINGFTLKNNIVNGSDLQYIVIE